MSSEIIPYSMPYDDIQRMAQDVVKGGLFPGIKTVEQAITLFMVAQSEGMHPMTATMRYHVIQGRPAMKADAMLAEFMRRGGTVNWLEWTNDACEAEFISPGCPQGVKVRWTMEDAKRAGVTGNPTWTKYPRQMLKARVASDGVRMTDPAVNQGRYSPEETRDIIYAEKASLAAPEEPTGPSELEGQLKRSLGETPEPVRLEGTVAPGHCTFKGCLGEVEIYVSQSKDFPGREYFMCSVGYEEKQRLLNEGATNKLANAAVAHHYRAWCEPWKKSNGAGEAASDPAADLPPPLPEDAPAPSIFDGPAIERRVARKLAKEKAAAK